MYVQYVYRESVFRINGHLCDLNVGLPIIWAISVFFISVTLNPKLSLAVTKHLSLTNPNY